MLFHLHLSKTDTYSFGPFTWLSIKQTSNKLKERADCIIIKKSKYKYIYVTWLKTPVILTGDNPFAITSMAEGVKLMTAEKQYGSHSGCTRLKPWITGFQVWGLTTISTVSPHCHTLSSYCVSLWMLWKELHCTLYNNWWAFSSLHALKMKTACLSYLSYCCSTSSYVWEVELILSSNNQWCKDLCRNMRNDKAFVLQIKVKFRLKFLNLGWFSIFFVS